MHFHISYDTLSKDIKYSDSLFPFIRETPHEKVTCYCNPRKAICMTALQKYFPLIKSRKELVKTIQENKELNGIYCEWKKNNRKNFSIFVQESEE